MARKIIFGSYDTDTNWGLTLTSYKLSDAEYKSSFVSVPGKDGDLDLSTALTDGEPRYNNRELTATFEISSGTRETRETLFSTIVNALDGRQVNITLPDDATHYITGRLRVVIEYNVPAHGALTITGNCEPWRYAKTAKTTTLTATSAAQTATLNNAGRRLLVPTVVISGDPETATTGRANRSALSIRSGPGSDYDSLGTIPLGGTFTITGEISGNYLPITYNDISGWVYAVSGYVTYTASVMLQYGTATWTLGAGTYALPDLLLQRGNNSLTYSGTGTAVLTWREAIL